jgi:hypothetical protein
MNELDIRARDLIDAARDADAPSVADRRRIKHKIVMRLLALGAAASSATMATAAGTMSAGAKVGLTVVAVLMAGGGTVGVMKLHSPRGGHHLALARATPVAVHRVASASMPKDRAPAPSPAPPPAELSPAPSDPVLSAKVRAPAGQRQLDKAPPKLEALPKSEAPQKPAEQVDQLNAEVAALKHAREQLLLGKPTRALEALTEYDRQFGKGMLAEERQAMAAIASCQARPGPAARALAESFLRSSPESPLLGRVRAACMPPSAQ